MNLKLTLPMKPLFTIVSALALAGFATAQESLPLDEAQKIARKLAGTANAFSDQPFTVDADGDKPSGLKGGEAGVIVLPDKRLSAETLANAGKTFTPVGQFWSHKITLTTGGKVVASDKLRIATVGDGERSLEVQLFLLGVTKNEKGALELVVFGKGSEPLFRVALEKRGGGKQEFPIEVSGRGTGEGSALLTLNLLGQYSADIAVVKTSE